jgi:hypothetical protein
LLEDFEIRDSNAIKDKEKAPLDCMKGKGYPFLGNLEKKIWS